MSKEWFLRSLTLWFCEKNCVTEFHRNMCGFVKNEKEAWWKDDVKEIVRDKGIHTREQLLQNIKMRETYCITYSETAKKNCKESRQIEKWLKCKNSEKMHSILREISVTYDGYKRRDVMLSELLNAEWQIHEGKQQSINCFMHCIYGGLLKFACLMWCISKNEWTNEWISAWMNEWMNEWNGMLGITLLLLLHWEYGCAYTLA